MFYAGWFLFAIIVGVGASSRGRSGLGWFLLSLLLSPLIGFVLLVLLPPIARNAEALGDQRKCPDCAELIKVEARVCKHCGARFALPEPNVPSEPIGAQGYGVGRALGENAKSLMDDAGWLAIAMITAIAIIVMLAKAFGS